MEKRLYLCADLGTSSLKAALIDSVGSLHGFARVYYACQESAASWFDAFLSAVDKLGTSSTALVPVSAIVISGNGPTLVPVTGDNPVTSESLRPMYWHDPVPATKDESPLSEEISSLFLFKVKAYIQGNEKNLSGIQYLFSPQEWLSWKLGARPVTVIPHQGYVPYYWDDEQCKKLSINQEWFPPFVKMGDTIGELRSNMMCGHTSLLKPGTPIVAGAADFIMALIGTGTLKPGMACDRTGSSEGINLCVESVPGLLQETVRVLPHAVPELWNLGAIIPRSGSLFEEYRSDGNQEEKTHSELVQEILANQSHSGRIVLETMAHNFINALSAIEKIVFPIKELTLSGGQCADYLWNQYKAHISGRILKVPEIIHAELAGNAVLCEAAFSGESIQETAEKMIRIKKVFSPV
ncbi:MAG: FGGY-family carbohydrate kinase [Treponema sp.]|nr:FGGY-family carbohydrate kinase [Treponema sp.]